ncbi:ATP-binding protein, partial [Candidatus Fermentibacteria bacterium]|nr:ATP-binding protein [Candidatus Fermentibacteria bacterium]
MRPIFESCVPRDEVLSGELRDEMFAARLKDVVEGHADTIYQDPLVFFDNTFVTAGLRTLAREVVGRLSGKKPSASPFVRLETSFGGGKTHSLIALHHLARGGSPSVPENLVPRSWIPSSPWKVAALVGNDIDPANGVQHGSIQVRTLWGELAWQLAGEKGYALIRESDEKLVSPGVPVLETLVGEAPTLIMMDELARHYRTARAVATREGHSNLAEQAVAFLMSMIELASSRQNVSLVITLAESVDTFGSETEEIRRELDEARKLSARQELIVTPTGEDEISNVVNHRLFKSIKADDARATSKKYGEAYAGFESKGAELPAKALRAEYASEIEKCYPFHPELLSVLSRRVATIPNFQRTRGVLRLLARVVRNLWDTRPADTWLIHPHHVDLLLHDIANDLTSRLEKPTFL